ncbi:hypothetical protein F4801DRAFT_562372 [Xylaria longipes]|nr:hypothetical protein F4801DRAFT_562372 [Xylaria longipes]
MPFNEVARNGFSYAFGRFYTVPDRVERVAGSSLRDAFLPKLTAQAKQFIGYGGDRFVRGQLKHYGVMFDESELSGNGTLLFKKLLQAGKCDEVLPHITKLRVEMHEEWLAQVTPEELSSHPNWTMEKYFLTSGEPDCAKTTTVIGIPLDAHSRYRSSQICEAASKIAGLHQKTGHGPKTQTIFLGWDLTAVSQAAGGHAAKEREAAKAAEEEREKERAESHADYLKTLNREKGRQTHSPIGTYIVDCEEIERGWSDQAGT